MPPRRALIHFGCRFYNDAAPAAFWSAPICRRFESGDMSPQSIIIGARAKAISRRRGRSLKQRRFQSDHDPPIQFSGLKCSGARRPATRLWVWPERNPCHGGGINAKTRRRNGLTRISRIDANSKARQGWHRYRKWQPGNPKLRQERHHRRVTGIYRSDGT